jgi:hypothetical protein
MIHIKKLENAYAIKGGDKFTNFGDPYDFSMDVELFNNDTEARISSFTSNSGKPIDSKYWNEIMNALKLMGVTKIHYERIKNGKTRYVTKEIL